MTIHLHRRNYIKGRGLILALEVFTIARCIPRYRVRHSGMLFRSVCHRKLLTLKAKMVDRVIMGSLVYRKH